MNATRTLLKRRLASPNALLAIVCLAQFMVILDVSVVNVALPSIRSGLHFSATGLQWVINAYTLTFAGLLMLGGRSADLLGRRRVFLAGTAMFALSSLLCALAASRGMLIAARGIQGIAGAVSSPATLSIITSTLPEGRERNRGLAAWGAVGALGASSGALLGGALTQWVGWQAIFAVNVPLGALVLALGPLAIPSIAPVADRERHFDALGAALITGGLVAVAFGIVRTDTVGWASPGVLAPLCAGVLALAAFGWVEARVARAPLVPLRIFRLRRLRAANLVVLLLYAANFPTWFFITLYLQQVLHMDAIEAGLAFLPMTGSIFLGSTLAPRVVARLSPRVVIVAAMACTTAGLLELSGITPGGSYLSNVLAGSVLTAIGMGFTLVPATIVAMQGVAGADSGVASGVLNTSRLLGGALGLAVLATIASAGTAGHVGAGAARALTHGFDRAFLVAAALALVAAAVAAVALRPAADARAVAMAPAESAGPAGSAQLAEGEAGEPVLAA
ncbi:MAG: MFS transporter [Solirubrobacteraceae bacterium]